ncbi:MAG: 4'-phosphopantetheinyl transferase family protein [Paracoccaceae bacterium]
MRDLVHTLASLLPGAGVGWADPATTPPADLPAGATPQRRAEFAAGRAAAAMAMRALGLPAVTIPVAADRAPIWPTGLSGSITHTRTIALAAVARSGRLGIDIEPENAVTPDLWNEVLLPDERLALSTDPGLATLIFCAKEATYKAQYPLTRQLFGFDRLHITPAPGTFTARFTAQTGPIAAGTIWSGTFARAAGHILAALHHP